MKLISLNVWGGKVYEPLLDYIRQQALSTDIFCFQELFFSSQQVDIGVENARGTIARDIATVLDDYYMVKQPAPAEAQYLGYPISVEAGQAIFVRKAYQQIAAAGQLLYDDTEPGSQFLVTTTSNFQFLQIQADAQTLTIGNLHGVWQSEGKADTPERLEQSHRLLKIWDRVAGPKILTGDFNMLPDTDSFRLLATGNQDIIKQFRITTTRSELYSKDIPFSDYVLASPQITITDFKIPDLSISDHLPLELTFDV